MNVTDFNFELPPELIAQDPLEDRAASRLLVLDKKTKYRKWKRKRCAIIKTVYGMGYQWTGGEKK